jgi:hypothetical protein
MSTDVTFLLCHFLARIEDAMHPERHASVLAEARERAVHNQEPQVQRVAQASGRDVSVVTTQLGEIVDRVEIRITRSLSVGRYLRDELEAGQVPTIRCVFKTGRQDHTEDPITIAGIVCFRQKHEGRVFGAAASASEVEDRPKFGFAYFSGTPTEPLPFGPVCFLLNLESSELRERVTLTPVDSSVPGLAPEEVGTLDHPLNAFARSSDALRAGQVLTGVIPTNSGIRDNAREGTPEAQVWGPLPVTADQIRAIIVEVVSADDPDLNDLRVVAERQGIPLEVRMLGGGS